MIYADNAATKPMSKSAKQAVIELLDEYGNPSSAHTLGISAKRLIKDSEKRIKALLGADIDDKLIFTSGGSEANNQALLSACKTGKRRIIISSIEHESIYKTAKMLEEYGFEVIEIPIDENGFVSPEAIKNTIDDNTALVSIMLASNEIGTLQPIKEIGAICRAAGVLLHTDAVSAVGHIDINVSDMNIDMLSMSAHKFGGMKGVGALYVRNGIDALPLIVGGNQQGGARAGTENVIGIASMAYALNESCDDIKSKQARVAKMRDMLACALSEMPEITLNGSCENRLSGNVNISLTGINSDAFLMLLDEAGICASEGSACHASDRTPSRVLKALGRDDELAVNRIRFSISEMNTIDEIKYIIKTVENILEKVRH